VREEREGKGRIGKEREEFEGKERSGRGGKNQTREGIK
jgi:hypothetical protein